MTAVEPVYLSAIPYRDRGHRGSSICNEAYTSVFLLKEYSRPKIFLHTCFPLGVPLLLLFISIAWNTATNVVQLQEYTDFDALFQSFLYNLDVEVLPRLSINVWIKHRNITENTNETTHCETRLTLSNESTNVSAKLCLFYQCSIHTAITLLTKDLSSFEPLMGKTKKLLSSVRLISHRNPVSRYVDMFCAGDRPCARSPEISETDNSDFSFPMGNTSDICEGFEQSHRRLKTIAANIQGDINTAVAIESVAIAVLVLSVFVMFLLSVFFFWRFHSRSAGPPVGFEKLCDSLNLKYQQIIDERLQSEELLFQMLPISVAKKLIDGVTVEPETFDEVTLYFSDIVGFNDAALSVSPIQIVNFLNSIYGQVTSIHSFLLSHCCAFVNSVPSYSGMFLQSI